MYFGIGTIFARFFSILIVPFLATVFSPSELGEYDLIISSLLIITPFTNLQMQEGQLLYALKEGKAKDAIYNSVLFCTITSLFWGVASFFILSTAGFSNELEISLLLVVTSMWPVIQNIFRSYDKPKLYAIVSSLVTPVFCVYLFIQFKINSGLTLKQVLFGLIFSYSLLIIPITFYHLLKPSFNLELLKKIVKYSFPFIFNTFFWWLNSIVIRYLLGYFHSMELVGKFAVDFKIASIIVIMSNIIYMTFQSESFRSKEVNTKTMNPFVLLFIISLALSIVAPLLINNFLPDFFTFNATSYTLLISAFFQGCAIFEGVKFQLNKNSKFLFVSSIISSMVGLIFAYPLVLFLNEFGSALSLLISNLLLYLIRNYKKHEK